MDAPLCPTCSTPMLPVVYGYPDAELVEAERRGEVIIGGCVLFGDDPDHACPRC